MIGAEQAIASGYGAFKRADYDSARKALSGVSHPQAIHLLGLVEKGAGNYAAAKGHLERAAKLDGANPEIANNQGLLARLMGEMSLAEAAFRRALALRPDFRSPQLSLGRTLHDLGKYKDAMAVLEPLITDKSIEVAARVAFANSALEAKEMAAADTHIMAVLAIDPAHSGARHARGVWQLETGQIDAAKASFQSFVDENKQSAETYYMLARVALEQGDVPFAQGLAGTAFEQAQSVACFSLLADIHWMTGDKAAFYALMETALAIPALALSAISFIRQSGKIGDALERLRQQPDMIINSVGGQSLQSGLLLDLGDADGAVVAGRAAVALDIAQKDNFNLVNALLAAGEAHEALALVKQARAKDPFDQFWLAYEVTALRMMGDAQYDALIDYHRHVQIYELPVPDGFASLEAFNAAFLDVLEEMNPLAAYPLKQSLRGGAQAPHDLSVSQHPLLQAYFKALDGPIRRYMADLGPSEGHPSFARNTGKYKFSGGWSVRLDGGGHHINHVHPRGWISSAYYVAVPPETAAGDDKSGWIKFGEPPIATKPALGPEKWVQPRAGMLVLFPSFLWHGTEPIHDGAVRVTAPFDVVPD